MSRPRFWDPDGTRHGGTPTFPWRMVPDGYATRRQLRAQGLRPGGQDVAAQILWNSRKSRLPRAAYLYRIDAALPVRPMTERKTQALAKANRAKRICPECGRDAGHEIPRKFGACGQCTDGYTQAA